MDVVRDVLDKRVVDRNGRDMGRVDGVLLECADGRPPRLEAILIGPAALGSRLRPGLGRLAGAVERAFGIVREQPEHIDFSELDDIDRTIRIRLTIGETAVGAIETRLRNWVSRLPGSQ